MSKTIKIILLTLCLILLDCLTGLIYANIQLGYFDLNIFFKGITIYSTGTLFVYLYFVYKIVKSKE